MNSMPLAAVVLGMTARISFGVSLVQMQQQSSLQSQGLEPLSGRAGLDRASYFTERGFETIVKLRDDGAMGDFVKCLLAIEGKYVVQDREGDLFDFVQWFSGTKATQSYTQMRSELSDKSWVKDLSAIDGASLSEMDYQAVASFRNDTAMSLLATALLTSVNKSVPREEQNKLAAFVPWFSGTKRVQTLQQMRFELLQKPWVQAMKIEGASGKEASGATENSSKLTASAPIVTKSQTEIEDETNAVESEPVETKLTNAVSREAEELESDDASAAQCGDCIVWGQAHILSFSASRIRAKAHPDRAVEFHARDGISDQLTVSEAGTYWLVNSGDVRIQGRYWQTNQTTDGLGLGAIAVSGPMVGNSTLVIRSLQGAVMWNEQEILHKVPSTFTNTFVKADYVADVGPVAGNTHAPGIKFIFSNGVKLTVGRYRNKLSARFTVCEFDSHATAGESQCGALMGTPRSKANAFFSTQRRAATLPRSEIIFPESAVKPRQKRH